MVKFPTHVILHEFDGRPYNMVCQVTNKEVAKKRASAIRKEGHMARVVTHGTTGHYSVFATQSKKYRGK